MSVKITYAGRLGNNVIQYCFARLFAERHMLRLEGEWCRPHYFPATQPIHLYTEDDIGPDKPVVRIDDGNAKELFEAPPCTVPRVNYEVCGYFQNAPWYFSKRAKCKSFFALPDQDPIEEDVVTHVRLTDHGSFAFGSQIIEQSWYTSILDRIAFRKLYVVTEDPMAYGQFEAFKKYNCVVGSSPSAADDFNFIRRFKRVILPNSTFSWAAVLLGHADQVWQWARGMEPDKGKEHLLKTPINLQIDWAEQVDGKYQLNNNRNHP